MAPKDKGKGDAEAGAREGNHAEIKRLTVGDLIAEAKEHGDHEKGRGWGKCHVAEDEWGRAAFAVIIAVGPFAEDLAKHYSLLAPGTRFKLSADGEFEVAFDGDDEEEPA